MHAYHRLEAVARYQSWTERSADDVADRLAEWADLDGTDPEAKALVLGVTLKGSDRIIGDMVLLFTDRAARQAEVGFTFNPDFHGQGLGSEAVAALMRFGFEIYGLHRICGRCDARNEPSWKLMARLGMRREAHFREHAIFKGRWDEEFHYAVLEDEWRLEQGRAD